MDAMRRPAAVDPVKAILSTPGCDDEILAGLPVRGQDADHALGQPGLGEDLAQHQRVQRGLGRGLEDDGVAREQRRDHLRQGRLVRGVPRDDRGDHADRFAAHHGAGRTGGVQAFLPSEGLGGPQVGGGLLGESGVRPAGEPDRGAVLRGDQGGELLGPRRVQFAEPGDDGLALARGHPGPGPAVEGLPGGGDRPVDVGGGSLGGTPDQ